jgi:S1-C subfamily serine protease
MRKILASILAVAIFTSSVFSAEPDKLLHTKCLYPTVFLLGKNNNGSGFVIKSIKHQNGYRNVFLTCGHNVEGSFPIEDVCLGVYQDWSKFVGYAKYPCYYYAVDRHDDIAVGLFETSHPVPVTELDFEPVYIGDEIIKVGCGLNDQFRVDFGRITGVNTTIENIVDEGLRINAYTVSGDSGGPITRNYKAVGITKAVRTKNGDEKNEIAYGVPIRNLKNIASKLDISVDFTFKEEPLPTLPFFFMKFNNLEEEK